MSKWKHRLTKINVIEKIASCNFCGEIKIKMAPSQRPRCETAYNENRKKQDWTRQRIAITKKVYDELFIKQIGVCAICKQESNKKTLAVDHDHSTGIIRGLLCNNCNLGIGLLKDTKNLQSAIFYLGRE